MGVPGMKADLPVRAKVRVGIKGRSASGKEFPKAVDYFVSDDPEFHAKLLAEPRVLRIRFPHEAPDDNFSTGMEYWRKNQLACYTKDSGSDPIALRVPSLVTEKDVLRGDPIKSGRQPISCPFRSCEFFKSKVCKPMGRLVFFIEGFDPAAGVWQLDTKSWNNLESLTGFLSLQGDPRGRLFDLSVAFEQRGRDRFPLLSITEVNVDVNNDQDIEKADALLQLRGALDRGEDQAEVKQAMANVLDLTNPMWRDDEDILSYLRTTDTDVAANTLLGKHGV